MTRALVNNREFLERGNPPVGTVRESTFDRQMGIAIPPSTGPLRGVCKFRLINP